MIIGKVLAKIIIHSDHREAAREMKGYFLVFPDQIPNFVAFLDRDLLNRF